MKIHQILDSIYLIPVILDHLDEPTETTLNIMQDYGFTPPDVEELRKVRHLLEYHYQIVESGFKPNYPLLRLGLAEYTKTYLLGIWQSLGMQATKLSLLDYGAGNGQYGRQFLKDNPEGKVLMVDRDNGDDPYIMVVDFEKDPHWYCKPGWDYVGKFDVVLLSEVLHCKDIDGQKYLIRSAYEMLKKKGHLVIIENRDYIMEYRIRRLKPTTNVRVVDKRQIGRLISEYPLGLQKTININKHQIYDYKKI